MRSLLADLNIGIRLDQLHLVHAVEYEIADSVYAVSTVFFYTACIDVCEVCICSALLEGNAYLNRCRLVVELDPQALKELESSFVVEYAFLRILLIVWIQMLVKSSRAECVPWVEFGSYS